MTTFADEVVAATVVRHLIEEHLAACGTIIPKGLSIYAWQGKIEETREVVVWIKTSKACSERCSQRLSELHPYDVPEIIVIEPSSVGASYAEWVEEVLVNSLLG